MRRSLAATFAAVLDTDALGVVACDGCFPTDELRAWPAGHEPTARPDGGGRRVATAYLVHADLILVVGRGDPVLRDRERQWISIMAELADHGWQELS